MKNLMLLFIFMIAFNICGYQLAYADLGNQMDGVDSVDEAVARLKDELENKGFEIVLIVNHAAAAKSVDLELRPTQVIYARPHPLIEHFLFKRSRTIGIDMPLKYLVYENAQGDVRVLSNPVGYLVDRHDVNIRDPLLGWLQSKTQHFNDHSGGLITLASKLTLEETVEKIKSAIPVPTFRIALELDFAEGGYHTYDRFRQKGRRPPFLLVFGNPAVGTPLMQADQRIGRDLPQEFLIWEDDAGGVNITWNDPFFIAARYRLEGQETRLGRIADALRNFARTGADE